MLQRFADPTLDYVDVGKLVEEAARTETEREMGDKENALVVRGGKDVMEMCVGREDD